MNLRLLYIIVIACSTLNAAVKVTENSSSRLTFDFSVAGFSAEAQEHEGRKTTFIRFEGQNCDLRQDDGSIVPGVSVQFGVPQDGDVSIRLVSASTRRVAANAPLPKGQLYNAEMQKSQPQFAQPWISRATYSRFSGYRVANIYIRPCQYEPQTGSILVLEKATCIIEFPSSSARKTTGPAPRNDYYAMLDKLLLNFNIAQMWGKPRARALAKRATAYTFNNASSMLMFHVGDGHSGYNEGTTDEDGIIKIAGSSAGMLVGDNINNISLFASTRETLEKTAPAADSLPDGVSEIPLLRFDIDSDGKFDNEDYVLANVSGTSGWFYRTRSDTICDSLSDTACTTVRDSGWYDYYVNPYEDYRHYWLLSDPSGGRTMTTFTQPQTSSAPQTTFTDRQMYRRVLEISNKGGTASEQSGTSWIWRSLNANSQTFGQAIARINPANDGNDFVRISHLNKSGTGQMTLLAGGVSLCTSCYSNQWHPVASWPADTLTLFLDAVNKDSYYELKSIEVQYTRRLDMSGLTKLHIFSSLNPVLVAYQVTGLPNQQCYIMRIPRGDSAASLIAAVPAGSTSYTWADSGGIGVQYYISAASALIPSPALEPWYRRSAGTYEQKQLRVSTTPTDFLIITDSILASQASRLARHKQSTGRFAAPRVVQVNDIYREFSGGNLDPAAIRNFLIYARAYWTGGTPFHVVLFGNGHYDYKGYITGEILHIPTAQFDEDCIEDFFVFLDAGEHADLANPAPVPDLLMGRLPCAGLDDAEDIVDKIVAMEKPGADYGPWRNKVLLVADDDMQGNQRDAIASSNPHHKSSEDVEMQILSQRTSVDIGKVYLFEYEWNEVYLKPEAARALINEINNGVGYINYFGHGSDDRWADEGLLSLESISSLSNENRYPVITSLSCSVGRFDIPEHNSMSDLLVKAASAGACASIASTRKAYASENEKLAESFYRHLFSENNALTVGQAYVLAKAENLNKNQKNYAILGDPSLRLFVITDTVALAVHNKQGAVVDTLMAMQDGVVIKGNVLRASAINSAFGTSDSMATVQIGLYNPQQDSAKRKDGGTMDVSYRLPGSPVFIGKTTFTAGHFEQQVFLPRSLFFNKEGVRLIAYAWHGQTVGVGLNMDIIFSGTDTTRPSDSTGPYITIRPIYAHKNWNAGGGFTDRISGMLPLECEINVSDESGIDIIGTGPDEGLTVEVPGAAVRQNINHKFLFNEGDFRRGTAAISFEEGELDDGEHEIIITAQDMLGNITRFSAIIEILPFSEFKLGQIYNYPNPFRMGLSTRFYFSQSNTYANDPNRSWYGTVSPSIRIYTLSGKLVRVIKNAVNGQQWDGTDEWGNHLAPNVYLYRVVADVDMYDANRTERSKLHKLVIRPPR